MSEIPRVRRIVYGAASVALALLLVLALLEIGLRVYAAITPNADVEFYRYASLMKGEADSEVRFLHTPNTSHRLLGVDVEINSRGFRDVEIAAAKEADEVRIGVLGDSITFGWGVPYGQRFTELLEDAWSSQGPYRFQLVNTGHGNYNSVQQLAMLREHLAADPLDGLLQVWYINDAEPTPEHREAPWYARFRLAIFLWAKADLLSRRAGQKMTYVDYYRELYGERAPASRDFERSITGVGEIARERDLPWVFVVLPEFHGFDPAGPFEPIYSRVTSLAEEAGAIVVSAVPAFRDESPESIRVAVNDVHPNAKGHAIIARAILSSLPPGVWRREGT